MFVFLNPIECRAILRLSIGELRFGTARFRQSRLVAYLGAVRTAELSLDDVLELARDHVLTEC